MSLQFKPLYFTWHDSWSWNESKMLIKHTQKGDVQVDKTKKGYHAGHVHLFFSDLDINKANSTLAYSGEQSYEFTIQDDWGPNSNDPSQNQSVKLIGKPILYFYVEEYWRRMYVQSWDTENKTFQNGLHDGKNGIRYDASLPIHSLGPFREGGEFYFFNTVVNRTVPVEYWTDKTKHTRDYFVKQKDNEHQDTSGDGTWTFENEKFEWVIDTSNKDKKDDLIDYGYPVHRKRNLHSEDRYSWSGMNVKRLQTSTRWNNSNEDNIFYNENIMNGEKYEINSSWTGWYEYLEVVKYGENYYRRNYRPIYYDKNNFDINNMGYSIQKRQYFPNPPPNLNSENKDDLRVLYWEYFQYYGNVRTWNRNGNIINKFNPNDDSTFYLNWENRVEKYVYDRYNGKLITFNATSLLIDSNYVSDDDLKTVFEIYLNNLNERNFFISFQIPETPTSLFFNRNEIYVTFSEFCKIWKKLKQEEIEKLKINGDYPTRLEIDLSSSSSSAFSEDFLNPFGETDAIAEWKKYFDKREIYTIPHGKVAGGDSSVVSEYTSPHIILHPREDSYSIEDGARWNYPDSSFIFPIIEYQKIIHLNWERLPEKQSEEDYIQSNWKTMTGEYGDGFTKTITIPFKKNKEVQSPFSTSLGVTTPIGTYCHDVVKPENMLRYHVEWYDSIFKLRKYDFPEYVKFIRRFQSENPWYREPFSESIPEFFMDEDDYAEFVGGKLNQDDELTIEQRLTSFFDEENETFHWKDTPITKRDDEGTVDAETGIFRDYATSNCIPLSCVSQIVNEDGTQTFGYLDSKGEIRKGGNVIKFQNPYRAKRSDGKFFEQCLGAIVKCKAVLVLEDALGYRWKETVDATALTSNTPLRGSDYGN